MSEEIKVVITLKGNRGFIGVQSPDCDPVFITFEGDLGAALRKVPQLVEEANRQWDSNPHYPKCELPLPSQEQPPVRATPRGVPPRQSVAQQTMF